MSPVYHGQAEKEKQTTIHAHNPIPSNPVVPQSSVFGLWEDPHKHGEKLHRERPQLASGFKPRTFMLWGNSTIHQTTMLPSSSLFKHLFLGNNLIYCTFGICNNIMTICSSGFNIGLTEKCTWRNLVSGGGRCHVPTALRPPPIRASRSTPLYFGPTMVTAVSTTKTSVFIYIK